MMREYEKKEPVGIRFFEGPSLCILWDIPQHRTFEGRKGYSVLDLELADKRPRGILRFAGDFLRLTTRGFLRLTRGFLRFTRGHHHRAIKIFPEKRWTHERLGAHLTSSVRGQIMTRYENI